MNKSFPVALTDGLLHNVQISGSPLGWDDWTDGESKEYAPPMNEPMLALPSRFAQLMSDSEVQQAKLSAVPSYTDAEGYCLVHKHMEGLERD